MLEILGPFKDPNPSRDCMSEILLCGWFAWFRQSGVLSLSVRNREPAVTCRKNHRGELSGMVTDGGAWLKSVSTDWVMVRLILTEFSWLSVFSGQLKWFSVFRDPVYRVDPPLPRTGQASRHLAFEFSESPLYGSSFLHMHNTTKVKSVFQNSGKIWQRNEK